VDGQCRECAIGRHRWSVPSWETIDHPPGGFDRIRLYRWLCHCRFCVRICNARRVQIYPNPPLEIDVSPTMYINVTDAHGKPDTLPVRNYEPNPQVIPEPAPAPELLHRLHNQLGEL
jgi:hypothetical protein